MYESEYHIIAAYWPTIANRASGGFLRTSPATKHRAIMEINTTVAINREGSNIFFNCFSGPERNNVPMMEMMLPSETITANPAYL